MRFFQNHIKRYTLSAACNSFCHNNNHETFSAASALNNIKMKFIAFACSIDEMHVNLTYVNVSAVNFTPLESEETN